MTISKMVQFGQSIWFIRYILLSWKLKLGEFIDNTTNFVGLSSISIAISIAALGIFAIMTFDAGNDDDDSDSGGNGGLMQPIT